MKHELQHIVQVCEAACFVGIDKLSKIVPDLDKHYYENAIEKLGKISPNSEREKFAKKCYLALKNYVDPTEAKIKVATSKGQPIMHLKYKMEYFIDKIRYKNNFLEKNANAVAKPLKESSFSFVSLIKRTIATRLIKSMK